MKAPPDFKTYQERDAYFTENADYFTVVNKAGVGQVKRSERKTLAEAERLAQDMRATVGGRYLIYAVIGEQSALVKPVG